MVEVNAVSSSSTNLTTGASNTGVSNTTSGVATMSFDDFIDMINPLQHIPIVSSIYRAVTGETMNPISRIAGDTLYGGIFGLASAGIAALGAVGDEIVAENNDGKGISQTVVAALFGDDADKAGDGSDTQIAAMVPPTANPDATTAVSTGATAPPTQVAYLQTPAKQSPILEFPDLSVSATPGVQTVSADVNSTDNNNIPLAAGASKGLPLDRSKLAYGGVMDNAMMQSAQQNQALALALAGGTNAMQAQRDIRNSRFSVGSTPATPTQTVPLPTQDPSKTASAIAAQIVPNPGAPADQGPVLTQPALQNLMQQLQAMKGINQYRNAAQSIPAMGAMLNTAN